MPTAPTSALLLPLGPETGPPIATAAWRSSDEPGRSVEHGDLEGIAQGAISNESLYASGAPSPCTLSLYPAPAGDTLRPVSSATPPTMLYML